MREVHWMILDLSQGYECHEGEREEMKKVKWKIGRGNQGVLADRNPMKEVA